MTFSHSCLELFLNHVHRISLFGFITMYANMTSFLLMVAFLTSNIFFEEQGM